MLSELWKIDNMVRGHGGKADRGRSDARRARSNFTALDLLGQTVHLKNERGLDALPACRGVKHPDGGASS